MLHTKQLNSKKIRFDKILVIQPIAEVYGEGNERQLCWEIDANNENDTHYNLYSETTNGKY